MFGRFATNSFISPMEISTLNGTNGFVINGIVANDNSGRAANRAGDVNGDGVDDIIIGAHWAEPGERNEAGQIYVIYSRPATNLFASTLELSSLNGVDGFVINGLTSGWAGFSVSGAGDVNSDGNDDVVTADSTLSMNKAGGGYVIFGRSANNLITVVFELASLNETNGFVIVSIDANDKSGLSTSGVGDVNNDGTDDVIIGAPLANPGGRDNAGQSYVIYMVDLQLILSQLYRNSILSLGLMALPLKELLLMAA